MFRAARDAAVVFDGADVDNKGDDDDDDEGDDDDDDDNFLSLAALFSAVVFFSIDFSSFFSLSAKSFDFPVGALNFVRDCLDVDTGGDFFLISRLARKAPATINLCRRLFGNTFDFSFFFPSFLELSAIEESLFFSFNFSVLSTETVPKLDVDDAEEARRSRTTPDNLESIAGVSFTVVLFFLGCFACVGASLLTLCTREGGTVAMVVVVVVVVVVVAAVRVVVVVVIVADIIVVMAATEVVELEADRLSSVLLPPIAGWFGIGSIFLKSGGSVWIFEG